MQEQLILLHFLNSKTTDPKALPYLNTRTADPTALPQKKTQLPKQWAAYYTLKNSSPTLNIVC